MLSLSLDAGELDGLRRGMRRLPRLLDDELERAISRTGRAVARKARASHEYIDRTGRLTRSIRDYAPVGAFSEDTLEGMFGSVMPYASYIEDGTERGVRAYQYLGGAWIALRLETRQRMRDALEEAVRRAGL